jgi:Fungal Zn(2)-Cys(6) binuclear cluster domain
MSTLGTAAELPASASHSPRSVDRKPRRLLACVFCQQRKVKCDHNYPCATCVKARVQCVPATQVSHRRRRFPERTLLERLRTYEDLLTEHNVKFEPLHPRGPHPNAMVQKESSDSHVEASYDSDDEPGTTMVAGSPPGATTPSEIPRMREAKCVLSKCSWSCSIIG